MLEKHLPFTKDLIEHIIEKYPTPFYIYDEKGIRQSIRRFRAAFTPVNEFTNYFAVKALPNPHILRIIKDEGFGFDCSSLPELLLAEMAGAGGEEIMFTSNETPLAEYEKAQHIGGIINVDDITHIDFLHEMCGLPDVLCFRYNPGSLREGNAIIGVPEQAKFGLTRPQLFQAYAKAKDLGVKRFGLHTMLASNELDPRYFIDTADMLFDLVVAIARQVDIRFSFVNLGGGIGIPYKPEQAAIDLSYIASNIQRLYQEKIVANDLHPLKVVMECGRAITGPHGYLVATAIHEKHIYRDYIGLDACMANLMRPSLYNAYHHITVLGKEHEPATYHYDVVGSLCENFDKLAIDRALPQVRVGDHLVFHDVGAHGHAMGFNYNGKLRSAEFLLQENGDIKLIRRAETIEDYFQTLNI